MDWLKRKKKARAYDQKQRLVRGRERGAMLLEDLIECCDGKSNPIKFFSKDQILEATDNFSKSNLIERYWYSGKNENHHMILIKRVLYSPYNLCRDIAISSMVSDHKNFLKLVGCCLESRYPPMVYHGVKKHYQLQIRKQSWKRRMKIAEDIATALAYLHTAFPRPFVYRNMDSRNILLDEDGVAKLCDFSNCISIPEGETFVKVDKRVGSYAYIEPDYFTIGVVSEKTDVYATGVFMRQLLTGEEIITMFWAVNWLSGRMEEGRMEEGRMDAIPDPKMVEEMGGISEEELCQMEAFLMLSHRCVGEREVPTMVEVVKELKKIQRSL